MRKPNRFLAAAVLLAAAMQSPAWAHAMLKSASPAKDAEVSAPQTVTLHFSEKLEPAFSHAEVLDAAGKPVSTDKAALDQADPSVMTVAVPALAPGRYSVHYVAVGDDGHRRQGDYAFTVK
ncbi:MAG: copper homeostasis periplasmic binding protein CopC [Burkholderiaceae bacterium]